MVGLDAVSSPIYCEREGAREEELVTSKLYRNELQSLKTQCFYERSELTSQSDVDDFSSAPCLIHLKLGEEGRCVLHRYAVGVACVVHRWLCAIPLIL